MEKKELNCFMAYDIRGRVPEELNQELAYDIGRAYVTHFAARKVVIGHDIRLSSPELARALSRGLRAAGADVVHLGLCGTEEMYHAVFSLESDGVDGGIIVTASHNPSNYNGMKFVTTGAKPVSADSGLNVIKTMLEEKQHLEVAENPGREIHRKEKKSYIHHLLGYVDCTKLKPLKLVVNSGNGCSGTIIDLLEPYLPFTFIRLNHEPDGTFPRGVPNPLLPENRQETKNAVVENAADLGIAWDGDFDRCFFWDETGTFIEGYYLVGLLASEMLKKAPGSKILHDPRLVWNTEDLVSAAGGIPVSTRTGHAFIKERMRQENAVYGGEMSAHHYFRDFAYCDSGMIPWLLVCALLSKKGKRLSDLLRERMLTYPVSGEMNFTVADPDSILSTIAERFSDGVINYIDGLSVAFPEYRFNVRKSNTEPLLRLNVETRGNLRLLKEKTDELIAIIKS